MLTNHIDKLIDAYLDNQLPAKIRREVELHVRNCPNCARLLFDTQQIDKQLGPTLHAALGRPSPPRALRHKTRAKLESQQNSRRFVLSWTVPLQLVNNLSTVAIIGLLAFGLVFVIQSQTRQTADTVSSTSLSAAAINSTLAATPAPASAEATPVHLQRASDTLVLATPPVTSWDNISAPVYDPPLPIDDSKMRAAVSGQPDAEEQAALKQLSSPPPPQGTIAFALYSPDLQMYEVHFVNPDGSEHRHFPLGGISEPALHPANDNRLAFRAWSQPTSPRSLFSSDLAGDVAQSITDFWEDAQPDWSPIEDRIIFASQRESDRRWRLYTAWGDGSLEVNLRREGKAPTFAPDGYRFAFESCDDTGNNCGLWVGDLEHSEHESEPILNDPLARSPDWSPTSDTIAYMANPDDNWDIYLVNSDGSNLRRLTDNPANDGLPTWSQDGKWLAFVSDRGEVWGIWLLHIKSGTLQQVITFDEGTLLPPDITPYSEHGERYWWDEQLSWGP